MHETRPDPYGLLGLIAQRLAILGKFSDDAADWIGIGASQTSELGRNGQ